MSNTYQVLIIEDDFRIANIHQQFVEKVEGFSVIATTRTAEDALNFLQDAQELPHLILLDIYIPDAEGFDLFWKIRSTYKEIDIIIISAANETATVQEAMRGGIFDYVIKPADIDRFEQTLKRYKEIQENFSSKATIAQEDIDYYILPKPTYSKLENADLPKGIDAITLNEITSLLHSLPEEGITAVELSKQIGTSRSTARRYLEYLVSTKEVETKLKYGTVGRPERKYFRCETYEQNE